MHTFNKTIKYIMHKPIHTAIIERYVTESFETAMTEAYEELFEQLHNTGTYLYRIWNFIPDIDKNYKQFNAIRHQQFAKHEYCQLPVSVCVSNSQPNLIGVFAEIGNIRPIVIENPRQVPTTLYPDRYGRPYFARAALVEDKLQISGTASIVGSASIHHGDVIRQTKETLLNIDAIINVANILVDVEITSSDLMYTVYLKHESDRNDVFNTLQVVNKIPLKNVYFEVADMCRPELLVEIEAYQL